MFSSKSIKNRKLLLALVTRLILVFRKLFYFDWLMSPEKSSQPIARLTSRQLWCVNSYSEACPIGSGKDGLLDNRYKKGRSSFFGTVRQNSDEVKKCG